MPTSLIPAEEIKAYLVAQGIAQDNATAPSLVLPGVWLNPRDRAPEPRAGENATLTVYTGPEIARDWYEGFLQERVFDFVVRARKAPQGELIQRQIRAAFEEKKHVMFGQLLVEWSKLDRGEQPVTADETSYSTIQGFHIAYRIVSLTV
jgi:hypothetical protein